MRDGDDGYRLSWTTEYRDLRDAFAWNLFRRWRMMRYLRIALFAVVVLWIAFAVTSRRFDAVQAVEVAAVVVALVFAPDLATWTFWRANAAALRRGSTGTVTADGLAIHGGARPVRFGWAEIERLEQTRNVWLFRMARSKNLVMVPKRAVPVPDEEFAAYVDARLRS